MLPAEALEQEIIHRLHEPDDEEMAAALDRLLKNYYSAYCAIKEYREHPERLEGWRAAEKPSQEWRKGFYFEQGLSLLATNLYS